MDPSSSPKAISHADVDETTPLIAASGAGPTAPTNEALVVSKTSSQTPDLAVADDDKPLPKVQIFLLCFARLVEPMMFFCIFPFINQMISEVGSVEEVDVGFYSGLIESLFSCAQMLVMIGWGRLADSIGRKPVLVVSLIGSGLSMAMFGLSKQIWQMILFRCISGCFSGSVVTVRTMTTENSTPKTQARAFSFFAFAGNLGIFLGPLLGGALAQPATQYPNLVGGIRFFEDNPYALPTLATGGISVISAVISALFLEETLKHTTDGNSSANGKMSILQIIKSPGVPMVIWIYLLVNLGGLSYTAVIPLFWFTSIDLGGFGFTPLQISLFLAINGISQALWLLLAFPPLQHRIGTGGVLRACGWAWPCFFLCYPVLNLMLKNHLDAVFWALAPTQLAIGSGVSMAFTCGQLIINDIVPSRESMATLNAFALSMTCGLRAIVPALFASLFATGAKTQWLGGYFIWIVLAAVISVYTISSYHLPEKAEGKLSRALDDEESNDP